MSDYGEGIIERLNPTSGLKKDNNPGRTVIMNTIGAWLDDFDIDNLRDNFFLQDATGGYLDLWGQTFGVPRKLEEDDDSYRQRIVLESLGHLTSTYIQEVYELNLYCHVDSYNPKLNKLTSDNPYISQKHMTVATSDMQAILNKKFVLGNELTFLTIGD